MTKATREKYLKLTKEMVHELKTSWRDTPTTKKYERESYYDRDLKPFFIKTSSKTFEFMIGDESYVFNFKKDEWERID